jgi:hypothetical protein
VDGSKCVWICVWIFYKLSKNLPNSAKSNIVISVIILTHYNIFEELGSPEATVYESEGPWFEPKWAYQ